MSCAAEAARCRAVCQQQALQPFRAPSCRNADQCRTDKRLLCITRANRQDLQQRLSRRQAGLAAVSVMLGLGSSTASAASSDLMEGTQNWLNLGVQSYSLWAQSLMDGISNDDQTGVVQPKPPARRLRDVSVPGLSSFSFIHGTLVGATLIVLLSLMDSKSPQQQLTQQRQQPELADQPPQLRPEVEAALHRLLASPDTNSTFHNPVVHAALQDVRGDLRNITKYRDDPAVMQAFEKLLEIEDILERL